MAALVMYTLLASRRGNQVRGDKVSTPPGSALDLRLKGDPAWKRTVVQHAASPDPGATDQVAERAHYVSQVLAPVFADFLRFDDEERIAFINALGMSAPFQRGAEELAKSLDRMGLDHPAEALVPVDVDGDPEPVEPEPIEDEPVEDEPIEDEPVEDEPVEDEPDPQLQLLIEAIAAPDDYTIAEISQIAEMAGVALPSKPPRRKADLVALIRMLIDNDIDPADLG